MKNPNSTRSTLRFSTETLTAVRKIAEAGPSADPADIVETAETIARSLIAGISSDHEASEHVINVLVDFLDASSHGFRERLVLENLQEEYENLRATLPSAAERIEAGCVDLLSAVCEGAQRRGLSEETIRARLRTAITVRLAVSDSGGIAFLRSLLTALDHADPPRRWRLAPRTVGRLVAIAAVTLLAVVVVLRPVSGPIVQNSKSPDRKIEGPVAPPPISASDSLVSYVPRRHTLESGQRRMMGGSDRLQNGVPISFTTEPMPLKHIWLIFLSSAGPSDAFGGQEQADADGRKRIVDFSWDAPASGRYLYVLTINADEAWNSLRPPGKWLPPETIESLEGRGGPAPSLDEAVKIVQQSLQMARPSSRVEFDLQRWELDSGIRKAP